MVMLLTDMRSVYIGRAGFKGGVWDLEIIFG